MVSKKKLKALDVLREALKVFANNSNFIFFTALTSIPLLLISLYFENLLQNFLLQTSQFVQEKKNEIPQTTSSADYRIVILDYDTFSQRFDWSLPLDMVRKLSNELFHELLHLGFLYLVPFNLLKLLTVIVVVDLASKLYREEKVLTFKDMLGIRFERERLQGILVTFLYVVLFSTFTLIGFVWLLMTYSAVLKFFPSNRYFNGPSFGAYYFHTDCSFHLLYGSNLLLLIGICLPWSAIWNLGLVVSVLEGKSVTKALGSSAYLCLRNLQNGMILMLVFSVWELGLRLPSLFFFGFDKTWPLIVAQSSLFCLGTALKWVCFVVYFEDCIRRLFMKKVDVEEEES